MGHKLIALGLVTIIIAYLVFYVIPVERGEFFGATYSFTYAAIENRCSDTQTFWENFGVEYSTARCEEARNLKTLTWILIILGAILIVIGFMKVVITKE